MINRKLSIMLLHMLIRPIYFTLWRVRSVHPTLREYVVVNEDVFSDFISFCHHIHKQKHIYRMAILSVVIQQHSKINQCSKLGNYYARYIDVPHFFHLRNEVWSEENKPGESLPSFILYTLGFMVL